MKKLVFESLNEWKLFGRKQQKYDQAFDDIDQGIDPMQDVYDEGLKLVKLFREIGFDDAELSGLGRLHKKATVGIMTEKQEFDFSIDFKTGDVFFDGKYWDADREGKGLIGNFNNPEELKKELEKILV